MSNDTITLIINIVLSIVGIALSLIGYISAFKKNHKYINIIIKSKEGYEYLFGLILFVIGIGTVVFAVVSWIFNNITLAVMCVVFCVTTITVSIVYLKRVIKNSEEKIRREKLKEQIEKEKSGKGEQE